MAADSNNAKEILEQQKIALYRLQIENHPAFLKIDRTTVEKEIAGNLEKGARSVWFLRPSSWEGNYVISYSFCGISDSNFSEGHILIAVSAAGYQWTFNDGAYIGPAYENLDNFIKFIIDFQVAYTKSRILIECCAQPNIATLSYWYLLEIKRGPKEGVLNVLTNLIDLSVKLNLSQQFIQDFSAKVTSLKQSLTSSKQSLTPSDLSDDEEDSTNSIKIDVLSLDLLQIMDKYCECMMDYINDLLRTNTTHGVSQLIVAYYDDQFLLAKNIETNYAQLYTNKHPILQNAALIFSHFQECQELELTQASIEQNKGKEAEKPQDISEKDEVDLSRTQKDKLRV